MKIGDKVIASKYGKDYKFGIITEIDNEKGEVEVNYFLDCAGNEISPIGCRVMVCKIKNVYPAKEWALKYIKTKYQQIANLEYYAKE